MGLDKNEIVNAAEQAIIDYRREMVARARLRGATIREIVEGLAKAKHVNPDTNEPWSRGTIHSDIKFLQGEWRREARKATDHHKARQLAELQEARRQAWATNDIPNVLRAIGQEMVLLGTEAPKKNAITDTEGKDVQLPIAVVKMPISEL